MRREGSAFQGLGVVTFKELSDHLTGVRMIVLEWLVVLMALGVVYTGIQQIREVSAEDPFLLLRLFTLAREHFTEKELIDLTMVVVTINGWNRISITFQSPVGSYVAGSSG